VINYLYLCIGLSPYHHPSGFPHKNSMLSASVDSIVTITTLAEDQVDTVVGQVAGWCGSFDKLLADPVGLVYLQVIVIIVVTFLHHTCLLIWSLSLLIVNQIIDNLVFK
jgi:hypothetical protein